MYLAARRSPPVVDRRSSRQGSTRGMALCSHWAAGGKMVRYNVVCTFRLPSLCLPFF